MKFYTTNPVFNSYFWEKERYSTGKMTLNGLLIKTVFGLFLVGISAIYVWRLVDKGVQVKWYLYGGLLTALFFSILTSYKQKWSPVTVPVYAIAKGCFLGAVSAYADNRFNGITERAILYTLISFLVMFLLYKLKIVKVTKQFRSIIYTSIATIFTIYLIGFILSFFGIHFRLLYGSSWISIGFTAIVVSVASFSLLLDFYFIEKQLYRAPKYKEWVATWGLLVTLIWMYVEILRLLKKLAVRF